MISQARHYETQIKLLQTAEADSKQWDQVMSMTA
jgi:flagellar basal body rod protein FlgF